MHWPPQDSSFGVLQALNPIGRPIFTALDQDIFEGLTNIVTGALVRFDRELKIDGEAKIEVIVRIPNGPVHQGREMIWPLETLLAGIEEGLEKAAQAAPEGIASIAVDSWSVDYVRLGADGLLLRAPFIVVVVLALIALLSLGVAVVGVAAALLVRDVAAAPAGAQLEAASDNSRS